MPRRPPLPTAPLAQSSAGLPACRQDAPEAARAAIGSWTASLDDRQPERAAAVRRVLEGLGLFVTAPNQDTTGILHSLPSSAAAIHLRQSSGSGLAASVFCYADGASRWSIRDRSRILLASSSAPEDSLEPDFHDRVRAWACNVVTEAAETAARTARMRADFRALGLIGASAAMMKVFHEAARVAFLSDLPLLLVGETGTGKDLLARALHRMDRRRSTGPFLTLNCAALTPELAEAELFGHRRGAFTGADRDRPGLFRAADRGFLFLDEVGELPLSLQGKLLRALQERLVLPVGHDHEIQVDVRVIAATNRNLEQMIEDGLFRRDLYHRLRVLTVRLPALADRRDDIPDLIRFFIEKHSPSAACGPPVASHEFVEALAGIPLPGNVRELENIVREAMLRAEKTRTLGLRELPPEILERILAAESQTSPALGEATVVAPPPRNLTAALDEYERVLVLSALRATRGSRTAAAQLLGVTPRSVYNKIRKHKLAL